MLARDGEEWLIVVVCVPDLAGVSMSSRQVKIGGRAYQSLHIFRSSDLHNHIEVRCCPASYKAACCILEAVRPGSTYLSDIREQRSKLHFGAKELDQRKMNQGCSQSTSAPATIYVPWPPCMRSEQSISEGFVLHAVLRR